MSGDFVIGLIVFMILIIVNFIVITKGATRIAEVGARFTLDAIPGKQMSIDADLSAGMIDDKTAQLRRRELEEESVLLRLDGRRLEIRPRRRHRRPDHHRHQHLRRHHHRLFPPRHGPRPKPPTCSSSCRSATASSPRSRRSSSRSPPACWSPRAARAARPTRRCSASSAPIRARSTSRPCCWSLLALMPGLPMFPFVMLGRCDGRARLHHPAAGEPPRRRGRSGQEAGRGQQGRRGERNSVKASLDDRRDRAPARQAALDQAASSRIRNSPSACRQDAQEVRHAIRLRRARGEAHRRLRASRRRATRSRSTAPSSPSTRCASARSWCCSATAPRRTFPARRCASRPSACAPGRCPRCSREDLKREQYTFADNMSVLLTHLSEVIRNNLPQLLSYKDMKALLDRPGSGIQASSPTRSAPRTSPIPACRRC